jgi:RNA polymerase sigma factor (sigma-70 family)
MGQRADDSELLDRYATSRDEPAFAELVRRYLNLVYSAAARRVGERQLAEDVTQAVFIVMAEKPLAARAATPLSAWLLATVRYAAANAVKIRQRRHRHERQAAAEATAVGGCSPNPSDVLVWREVAAALDDAVLKLPALDRRAVLLRFFEQRPICEVAAALNVSEAAAKQRLSRSVEKLRQRLNRGGAILAPAGAAGLATLMTAGAVGAAPLGLLTTAATATVAGTAGSAGATSLTIAKGAMTMMTWTKIKAVAAVLAIASILGTGAVVTMTRAPAQAQARAPVAPAPGAAQVPERAAARIAAAEKLLAALDQEMNVGNVPLTTSFVDLRGTAGRRLAEARVEAAGNDGVARSAAAEEYVRQCRAMLDLLNKRKGQDVTLVQLRQGEYHLADAEYFLASLRSTK